MLAIFVNDIFNRSPKCPVLNLRRFYGDPPEPFTAQNVPTLWPLLSPFSFMPGYIELHCCCMYYNDLNDSKNEANPPFGSRVITVYQILNFRGSGRFLTNIATERLLPRKNSCEEMKKDGLHVLE